MSCPGGLQGLLEVIGGPHFHNFSFERKRSHRRLGSCKLRRVKAGDAKDCYAREPGNDLFEQPYLFPAQLREIKKHSRHIAAWARKTFDIPLRNRIALQIQRNDRNAGRCIPGSDNRFRSCRENDVHFATNQIARKLRQLLSLEVGKAVLERNVFSFYVARFSHT
jgi:hypothetical protein